MSDCHDEKENGCDSKVCKEGISLTHEHLDSRSVARCGHGLDTANTHESGGIIASAEAFEQ